MKAIEVKVVRVDPWEVTVYSGHAHWDKPIGELFAAFETREAAEDYGQSILRYRPDYEVMISRDGGGWYYL